MVHRWEDPVYCRVVVVLDFLWKGGRGQSVVS